MSEPAEPRVEHQGPAGHCVIAGRDLSWLSCTCYACSMAANKVLASMGRPQTFDGCGIRDETGDKVGGTTLVQMHEVMTDHGIKTELHVGANVARPEYVARQLRAGRGVVLQGNAEAMLGTPMQSTRGPVNHAAYLNTVFGGSLDRPRLCPTFDPAADGHIKGDSPQDWPWSMVLQFAADLRPSGDNGAKLGPGKMYCLIFPDTEPHVHLKFGATRKIPFPDHVVGKSKTSITQRRFRRGPGWQYSASNLGFIRVGGPWVIYQMVLKDGTYWYGDHNGSRWLPEGAVSGRGGT